MKFQFNVGKVSINTTEVLGTDHINGTTENSPETKFHTAPVSIELENIGMAYELSTEEIDVLQVNVRENIETIATTIENHIEPIAEKFFALERKFEKARREELAEIQAAEEKRREEYEAKREAEHQARLEKLRVRNEELKFEHSVSERVRNARTPFNAQQEEILSVDPEGLQQEINKMVL